MEADEIGLRRLHALVFNFTSQSALAYRLAEAMEGQTDFTPGNRFEKPKKATKEEVGEFFARYVSGSGNRVPDIGPAEVPA